MLISTINALTLSPALCATVLRPHREAQAGHSALQPRLRGRAGPLYRGGEGSRPPRRGGAGSVPVSGRRDDLRLPETAVGFPAGEDQDTSSSTCNCRPPRRSRTSEVMAEVGGSSGTRRHPQRRRDRRLQFPHRHRRAEQRRAVRRSRALVRSRCAGAAGKGILERVRGG